MRKLSNRCLAFLSGSGKPTTVDQALDQQILYFLDDRHMPVTVSYFERLPRWLRGLPLAANLVYAFKLCLAPAATVLVDYALQAHLGLALQLARLLTLHRLVVLVRDAHAEHAAGHRPFRPTAGLCLWAAHQIVVHSEQAWLRLIRNERWGGKIRFLPYPGRKRLPLQMRGLDPAPAENTAAPEVIRWRGRRLRRWKPFELILQAGRLAT